MYVWGTSTETIEIAFNGATLIFIALSAILFTLYLFTDGEEERRMEGYSVIATVLVFGLVLVIFYKSNIENTNNREGLLQVYADHLVLNDGGDVHTYHYDEIEKVFLNRQMLIIQGRTPGRDESRPRYDSRDRIDVELKNGRTDTQGWKNPSFWSDRYAERIDLDAAEEALKNKVSNVRSNDVDDREVKDSSYFD